jgi:hypothetical protein
MGWTLAIAAWSFYHGGPGLGVADLDSDMQARAGPSTKWGRGPQLEELQVGPLAGTRDESPGAEILAMQTTRRVKGLAAGAPHTPPRSVARPRYHHSCTQ